MQSILRNAFFALCAALAAGAAHPAGAQGLTNVPSNCVGCDLNRADFHGRDLRSVKWVGVDLTGADLRGADLRGARMVGADLEHVRLDGARLDGSSLVGADFSDSNLPSISFAGARVVGADFERSDLSGSSFSGDRLAGVDFRKANLRNASFVNAVLCYRDEWDGHIGCSDFRGADLHGANFRGALLCESHDRIIRSEDGHTNTITNDDSEDADGDSRDRCRPVDAATLRTQGYANLNGAQGI